MKPEIINAMFVQGADDCSNEGSDNELTVETCFDGDGAYLVISTERWALTRVNMRDLTDALTRILDQVEGQWGEW